MHCNMRKSHRITRIIIGLAIIVAGIFYKNWYCAIGLLPLTTGLFGYCPMCSLSKKTKVKTPEKTEETSEEETKS